MKAGMREYTATPQPGAVVLVQIKSLGIIMGSDRIPASLARELAQELLQAADQAEGRA